MEDTAAIFRMIWEVAEGKSTLLDTPEEAAAGAPPVPPALAAAMPELAEQVKKMVADMGRNNRSEAGRAERQMAEFIVNEWKMQGIKRPE